MTLIDRLKADLLTARKARDEAGVRVLNPLFSESAMIGKNNGNRESTDDEVVVVVKKTIKGVEETLTALGSWNPPAGDVEQARAARGAVLAHELGLLQQYLPTQMSVGDLHAAIAKFRSENPSANMGSIMGWLKQSYGGQYDGKLASSVVKEILA